MFSAKKYVNWQKDFWPAKKSGQNVQKSFSAIFLPSGCIVCGSSCCLCCLNYSVHKYVGWHNKSAKFNRMTTGKTTRI